MNMYNNLFKLQNEEITKEILSLKEKALTKDKKLLTNISSTLKNSLWEYDIQKLHFSDNIVIVRALNFWEISDINLIISNIWKQKFLDIFLKNTSSIDNKSLNFWKLFFDLKNLNIKNTSIYEQINTPIFTRSFR